MNATALLYGMAVTGMIAYLIMLLLWALEPKYCAICRGRPCECKNKES